jgi:hypothetical protein
LNLLRLHRGDRPFVRDLAASCGTRVTAMPSGSVTRCVVPG